MKVKIAVSRKNKQLFFLEAQKAEKIKGLLQEFSILDMKFPESEGYRVTLSLSFTVCTPIHRSYVQDMIKSGGIHRFIEEMKAEHKKNASLDGAAFLIYWMTKPDE